MSLIVWTISWCLIPEVLFQQTLIFLVKPELIHSDLTPNYHTWLESLARDKTRSHFAPPIVTKKNIFNNIDTCLVLIGSFHPFGNGFADLQMLLFNFNMGSPGTGVDGIIEVNVCTWVGYASLLDQREQLLNSSMVWVLETKTDEMIKTSQSIGDGIANGAAVGMDFRRVGLDQDRQLVAMIRFLGFRYKF